MIKYLILILLLIPSVYACDWSVEIISENIFEDDFEFDYKITKHNGTGDVLIVRNIDNLYNLTVKSYSNATKSSSHTYSLTPNLDSGTYLIKGEIFPECNDSDLSNNHVEKLIAILPEQLGTDYSNLEITELLPDPVGNDTDSMPNGEWLEIYNPGSESLDLEGLGLKDDYGKEINIYISDSNTLDGTIIKPNDYLVVYVSEHYGFLTNDGFEEISLKINDALIDQVSYSNSAEGLSWSKFDNGWKKNIPSPGEKNVEENLTSYVRIEKIYDGSDDKVKFGEILMIRILAFKANTDKSSIKVYVEDMEKSSFLVTNPGIEYNIMIPIKVDDNCGGVLEDDYYKVIVEGLGDDDFERVYLEGQGNCGYITERVTKVHVPLGSERVINENVGTTLIAYESNNIKESRLGIYFLCLVLILFIIGLTYERTKSRY